MWTWQGEGFFQMSTLLHKPYLVKWSTRWIYNSETPKILNFCKVLPEIRKTMFSTAVFMCAHENLHKITELFMEFGLPHSDGALQSGHIAS